MRFHQSLADGEPETAADAALRLVGTDAGVLAEQVWKLLGRDVPALVADGAPLTPRTSTFPPSRSICGP